MITKNDLNELQKLKLNLAANMLKETAHLFNGDKSLLPLWGGGIITHGIPKIKACVIGITKNAKNATKTDLTNDHLYRVTETAKFVINKIQANKSLTVEEIENLLLERSALMTTTRTENNSILKDALKKCENKDNWKELYEKAGIEYELY